MTSASFRDDVLLPRLRRLLWRPWAYAAAQYLRALSWRTRGLRTATLPRELAVLERVRPSMPPQHAHGPRILFFSPRGQLSTVYDGLVAAAVRARGAQPYVLTCGGKLPLCSYASTEVMPPLPCTFCRDYSAAGLDAWALPRGELRALWADHEGHLAAHFAHVPVDQLADIEYQNVPIGRLVQHGVANFLRSDLLTADGAAVRAYRQFLAAAVPMVNACQRALEQLRPDRVWMTSGLLFPDAIMLHLCRRAGIPVFTYEWGHRSSTLVFGWNRPAGYFDHELAWSAYSGVDLTAEQSATIQEYLADRRIGAKHAGDVAAYWHTMASNAERVRQELGLDSSRPIVSLFTNILWDSALFERKVAFAGLREWLLATIDLIEAWPEAQLVIRVHPAEVRLPFIATRTRILPFLTEARPKLPPNVRVVPPESSISSYTLASLSAAGLVYASTVGLEMAAMGKPIVVAGKVHYAEKGFTLDVSSREAYGELVRNAVKQATLSPTVQQLALRYAYFFFFQVMRDFPLIDASQLGNIRLDVERLKAGINGGDAALNEICDALLAVREIPARPIGETQLVAR